MAPRYETDLTQGTVLGPLLALPVLTTCPRVCVCVCSF